MVHILDLPQEIQLDLITGYIGLSDSFRLIQTCKALYSLRQQKIFWVHIVRCVKRLRPVPLPSSLDEMSVDQLVETVFRAVKITSLLEKESITVSKASMTFYAIEAREPETPEEVENDIEWGWLLSDGIHLVSMSRQGQMVIWNIMEKRRVREINIGGEMHCWDHRIDSTGITFIANAGVEDERATMFRVWRFDTKTEQITLRSERKLPGICRSNFTRRTLAGCLLTDRTQEQLYFIDWDKCTEGMFTISFPGERPPPLSCLTSEDDVFIYTEDTLNAFYYAFPLKEIAERLTPSISHHTIAPATIQVLYHNPDDTRNIGFVWIPRCRSLWDGRTGVFSHSWNIPQIVTFSLIDILTGDPDENKGNIVDYTAGTGYVVAPAQRIVMKWLPAHGSIAKSVGGWNLWTVGGSAKGAAWLKDMEYTEASTLEVSILDVPPVEDEATWKLPSQTPLDPIDVSSTARGSTITSDFPNQLIGDSEPAENQSDSAVSSTATCNGSAEADEVEGDDSDETHERPPVFGFGHVCRVSVEDDWIRHCGGIYSLDFDDARGRLAFTTASGEIIVYDLISASDASTFHTGTHP
ncbi:hypothetical protein CPB86DRAFT_340668 [Serendipita vermifera]|nr:hypothetical protein CPB86DRAFT_340668 [Serendipita vermifera]